MSASGIIVLPEISVPTSNIGKVDIVGNKVLVYYKYPIINGDRSISWSLPITFEQRSDVMMCFDKISECIRDNTIYTLIDDRKYNFESTGGCVHNRSIYDYNIKYCSN